MEVKDRVGWIFLAEEKQQGRRPPGVEAREGEETSAGMEGRGKGRG